MKKFGMYLPTWARAFSVHHPMTTTLTLTPPQSRCSYSILHLKLFNFFNFLKNVTKRSSETANYIKKIAPNMAAVVNTEIFSNWVSNYISKGGMIVNDHFTTLSLLIHLHYKPVAVVITINNLAIIIIFNTTSILPRSGIALTLSWTKSFWNTKLKTLDGGIWLMNMESNNISQSRRKGPLRRISSHSWNH